MISPQKQNFIEEEEEAYLKVQYKQMSLKKERN
jgi:hypothetical protein